MTLYVLVPKCSRPCGVFTIWLSVHQALWTPLPLKQHFAELQATTFSEDLPSHFSGHSGVLCCPCASVCPLHRVVPHCLALHSSLLPAGSLPGGSIHPHTSKYQLGADVSQTLLQPSSSSCAPQPCIRWTPRSQQVPNSACPLTSTPLCLWVGDPKSPLAKLEPWQSFSRTKPPCPVKPTS